MSENEMLTTNKIDVHSHFFAPAMWKKVEKVLGPPHPAATFSKVKESKNHMQRLGPEERLDLMDHFGLEKSVFSFPSMPVYMGASEEVKQISKRKQIAKELNEYFAEVHQKYPKRLLFFADVPLSVDVEFSCRELHHAVEDLGLHGAAIPTNIAGKRPSNPEFDAFFTEAEKMGVAIFVHPQNAYGSEHISKYMFTPMLGYPAETSVTAAYMILDGFLEKHPNLKIILAHLGGFIPYIHRRINTFTEAANVDPVMSGKANLSKEPSEYLKQFYYDTALGNPEALELCLKVVGVDQILFGTDHPYVEKAEAKTINFISSTRLTVGERDKIYSLNARKLFTD
jgi:predicted TIM-barrel fold metal-dependent hydrolase